jgi:hypothetical protein
MAKTRHNRNQTFEKPASFKAVLFADDQVITADTEDNLRKSAHKLTN